MSVLPVPREGCPSPLRSSLLFPQRVYKFVGKQEIKQGRRIVVSHTSVVKRRRARQRQTKRDCTHIAYTHSVSLYLPSLSLSFPHVLLYQKESKRVYAICISSGSFSLTMDRCFAMDCPCSYQRIHQVLSTFSLEANNTRIDRVFSCYESTNHLFMSTQAWLFN